MIPIASRKTVTEVNVTFSVPSSYRPDAIAEAVFSALYDQDATLRRFEVNTNVNPEDI